MNTKNIYFDYSASTPVDPKVLEKMLPYFLENFGNPSSQHRAGWMGKHAVDEGRSQIAKLLNAKQSREIIFTSGASESNTLALLGYAQQLKFADPQRTFHAITSQVEHKSVLETFKQLKEIGFIVDFIPTNKWGQVEPETLKKYLKPETVLVSLMWANNEVGSINPMSELVSLVKEKEIIFHSDATQACGKIVVNVQEIPVDFLSLSSHKMYGPKGVGALYIRHENHRPAMKIWPLIKGGGHEFNLRAGTLNVPGIVGFGEAAKISMAHDNNSDLDKSLASIKQKTQNLYDRLKQIFPQLILNGDPINRLPGHLHLTFPGIRWDQWLPRMSQLCVSRTSACGSDGTQESHVLVALGLNDSEINSSIRISLGKFTTSEEIDESLHLFQQVFNGK